jgi:hypothetical protein
MYNDESFCFSTEVEYKWPHLSLCLLEIFFENDGSNTVSVKPIIHKYAEFAGLNTEVGARSEEKFREQTLSELLKSIVDMGATKREEIFNQKNLASLTVFIEIFIKLKIEVLDDIKGLLGNQAKIIQIETKIRQKGYVNKFVSAVLDDILGRQEIVKRKEIKKDTNKDTNVISGVKSPVRGVIPQIIHTTTRRIQIYPALSGAARWGTLLFAAVILSVAFVVVGNGFHSVFDVSLSTNCIQAADQGSLTASAAPLCKQNNNYLSLGYVLYALSFVAFASATFFGTKFAKIVSHNQFAATHNNFELTHHELTKG